MEKVLKESDARVCIISWHPQFDYILAAGSFDNIVYIHDIKFEGSKELVFHTDRVRSVQWNSEIPWLLTSGGDDSK